MQYLNDYSGSMTVPLAYKQCVFFAREYLSAIERAFSTLDVESTNSIYFIQTKLLFGEVLTSFSYSSSVLGISFANSLSSADLISRSLKKIVSN